MPKQTKIHVSTAVKFISDIPEIKSLYNNDLPHNAVIDKQVTGVGGTHLVLTNDVPYVVAVHLKKMIENKVSQDVYKHVCAVDGNTTQSDVDEYLNSGGIKFICTYDSVPKLKTFLGDSVSNYRLLVDEFHCLISYMDRFKPRVAINLLANSGEFKSVSYLTATPTNQSYLPEPLKKLEQVSIIWDDAKKPDLVHSYVPNSFVESVLSTTMHYIDNTDDELYIFYNSRRYVVSLIKRMIKLKPTLTLDNFNILFSETDDNTLYFKKYLGSKFKYGNFPDGVNNKRINIISSMGFEGCDFYPNQVTGVNPTTLVVSDPRSKSMRFDINVQLKQICGRFRANKLTGKMPKNKIVYLWTSQGEDIVYSESEYHNLVLDRNAQCIVGLEQNAENPMVIDALRFSAANHHSYWILDSDKKTVMMHPYAVEALMSSYHALHSDSFVLGGDVANSTTVTKLSSLSKDINTFTIPPLPSQYKKALGRIPSVQSLVTEYNDIMSSYRENPEFLTALECFLTTNTTFSEWLDCGVTPQNMNSLNSRDKIDTLARSLKMLVKVDSAELPFTVGVKYTVADIKSKLQTYYDKNNIQMKVKGTDIKRFYNVSIISDGGVRYFKIISKL